MTQQHDSHVQAFADNADLIVGAALADEAFPAHAVRPELAPELIDAYRFHRGMNIGLHKVRMMQAHEALLQARRDVAEGRKRYPASAIYPAVCWDNEKPGLAYIQDVAAAGLRHVGNVEAESAKFSDRESCGWYTDPHGDAFRDGTGLLWGVVYQLPARGGKARFVAGYQEGGTDGGPVLDLGTIYESDECRGHRMTIAEQRRGGYSARYWILAEENPRDHSAARDAAHAAESMARIAAEEEREYEAAWQAGSQWADTAAAIAENRSSVLATIRDLKGACATLRGIPDTIKARIRASIESDLADRSRLFDKLAQLAGGDNGEASFYPHDKRLIAAFNEGAGRAVLA